MRVFGVSWGDRLESLKGELRERRRTETSIVESGFFSFLLRLPTIMSRISRGMAKRGST